MLPDKLFPVDLANVKRLDIPASAIHKLSDEEIARFKAIMESIKNPPKPTPEQIEANKTYAEIIKDGKVVAKISQGGCAETSNAVGAKLQEFFATNDDRDDRAAAIAKAVGGTISYVHL